MKKTLFFLLLAGLSLAPVWAFFSQQIKPQSQPPTPESKMANPLPDDYEPQWRVIDSLDQNGLVRSALEKVDELYEQAKRDDNAPQLVKILIYRLKYHIQTEEDGLPFAIERLQAELDSARFPLRPILQSVLADVYRQYLANNRWSIQNRTDIPGETPTDIRTWSVARIQAESARLFWTSLEDMRTRDIPLDDYEAILTDCTAPKGFRPTLYDFLAHRAIDYFINEQSFLSQPAFKFYIDGQNAFAPVSEFIDARFETADTTSSKYRTLLLMQELLRFRRSADDLEALADADLKRIRFVYNNSVAPEKGEWYLQALEKMARTYADIPAYSEVRFLEASYYYDKGLNYDPLQPVEQKTAGYWKKAWEICDEAIRAKAGSFGAQQCLGLKTQLETKELSAQVERVYLPQEPMLVQVGFRNMPQAYFRLIRLGEKDRENLEKERNQGSEQVLKYVKGLKPQKSWSINLPKADDFRNHTTEIKIDAQQDGQYMLVVSADEKFKEGSYSGYALMAVSRLGYWERQPGPKPEIIVFDRLTGAPLKGVKAEFYHQNYNSLFRKYEWKKMDTQVSDESGRVFPKLPKEGRDYLRVQLINQSDSLFLDDGFSTNFYPYKPSGQEVTHFFTDRAIYRPGQTVYFKGILLRTDERQMPSILAGEEVTITFRDANYQTVKELTLRSNEFGTIQGAFEAPASGLLGQMSIASSRGGNHQYFRVEEYKRPKFEVRFDTLDRGYKLDDSVELTGNAQGYAGNPIDGAKVTYRVVREATFPWVPWWYWRSYPWSSETMEIANGTVTTDATGKFTVRFKAQPDRTVPADQKPNFTFRVYADVTDIAGETRSGATQVNVGYVALKASIDLPEISSLADFLEVPLTTQNLDGKFEAASGTLRLELLKNPDKPFIARYWEQPDLPLLSEQEFRRAFPHYPYKNENSPAAWEVRRTIWELPFTTSESLSSVPVGKVKLEPGVYTLTLKTADRYGKEVELQKVITLYDPAGKQIPTGDFSWVHWTKDQCEPGEQASFLIGSAEKELHALLEIERDGEILSSRWLDIRNLQSVQIPVEEKDRGNLIWHLSIAGLNRSNLGVGLITVPWSNKDLKIEYLTFRDKLLPGQEEEWQLKISGPKGEKVAAEMVATLYDASLDQFAPHDWGFSVFPTRYYGARGLYNKGYNSVGLDYFQYIYGNYYGVDMRTYPELNWFGLYFYDNYAYPFSQDKLTVQRSGAAPKGAKKDRASDAAPAMMAEEKVYANGAVEMTLHHDHMDAPPPPPPAPQDEQPLQVRTNLEETVFFKPALKTDSEGNILVSFKMNEALTRWKFLALAHTRDLQSALTSKEVVTQKDLMIQPNPPRFYRETDEIEFTAKVVNLSDKQLTGVATLQLVNGLTGQPAFVWENSPQFNAAFNVEPKQSARVAWRFKVPDAALAAVLEHTVIARSGDFSDGERDAVPVLSNRMLVTETLPLPVRGNQTRTFVFQSLRNNNSNTLTHHGFSLEFTSNPAWYAVQALPYLMEYPYDCTEQVFSRYYANSLATSVANSHPRIREVFDKWKDTPAMTSNLAKNQELKTALLEETPWVLQSLSEEEQKRNIGLLFDLNRMSKEQTAALDKLAERQLANGGFPWFPGDRDNWYITQYIAEGLGHLNKLGIADVRQDARTWNMTTKAVRYLDQRVVEYYNDIEKQVKKGFTTWEQDHLSPLIVHYLYMRSFFLEDKSAEASTDEASGEKSRHYIALEGKIDLVLPYFKKQAETYWLGRGYYQEGMISLSLKRLGNAEKGVAIANSLRERALYHDELGMYWKSPRGWWWYEHPIESQALMAEVFDEVANDPNSVELIRIWLLKNKQTNHWKTTKATALAVYALLMGGDNWLLNEGPMEITLGSKPTEESGQWQMAIQKAQSKAEAGTGYFKASFPADQVSKDMAVVTVHNPNSSVAWGGVYWQYYEQLDKITGFEETPLTLVKQLYRVALGPTGEILQPIAEGETLHPGDKLKVRIELRVDRPMEYVHMKDMRASGFEPEEVLSRYKWQGGLGYYESPRDLSTSFFISYLPAGTHVFEYPLRVVHKGDFSNGITSIQCMYAPEFSSHSQGIRVKVE